MLTLARHFVGTREMARAKALLQAAPQGEKVGRPLRAEADLLAAQIHFLEGRNAKAAEIYARVARQFGSVNGIPFRCVLHSMVIKSQVDIPVMPLDGRIYQSDMPVPEV